MSILDKLFGFKIRCSCCGRRFAPNLTDTPMLDDTGQTLRHFDCPYCSHRYSVAIIGADGEVARP